MLNSVQRQEIICQQRLGVMGECAGVPDLQYFRIAVRASGLDDDRSPLALDERDDAQLTDGIGQIVTVRIVAEDASPGGADTKTCEADCDIEICTTRNWLNCVATRIVLEVA
jgi:hypothetical protein